MIPVCFPGKRSVQSPIIKGSHKNDSFGWRISKILSPATVRPLLNLLTAEGLLAESAPVDIFCARVLVRSGGLPFDDGRPPSQARAENDQQNQVAPVDAALLHGIIQRNGHGCGGGVAIFVQVDKDLLGPGAQPFCDGVDNAAVGLMRDDALDLGDIQFAAAQDFLGRGTHGVDGALESFLAVLHVQEMHSIGK